MKEKDLDELRERIDAIDEMIVGLLNRRMECSLAIGELKRLKVRRFLDPARERAVLKRVEELNKGPLDGHQLLSIYQEIVAVSRAIQEGSAKEISPGAAKICVSIAKQTMEEVIAEAEKWTSKGFMVEWRADYTKKPDPERFVGSVSGPHLVTLRSRDQGGRFGGSVQEMVGFLAEALKCGAHFVDVEESIGQKTVSVLLKKNPRAKVVLSKHFTRSTPPWETLKAQALEMAGWGAQVVKIAATVKSPEDNLAILSLIPLLKLKGVEPVCLGMGHQGRLSRIACPLLGGLFTFGAASVGEETAEGQIAASELLKMLRVLYQPPQ